MTAETTKPKGFQAIRENLTALLVSCYLLKPASGDYRIPFKAAFMYWFRSTRYQFTRKYLTPPRAKRVQWFTYDHFNLKVTERTYRAVRILNLWIFFFGRISLSFDVPDWFRRLMHLQSVQYELGDAEEVLEERRWVHPDSYAGATFEDYFVIVGEHRDSGPLERSNFFCVARDLETVGFDVDERQEAVIATASHSGVGWSSTIMIHETASDEMKVRAFRIVVGLMDYPVVDEDHYSALELEETYEAWERMDLGQRIETCGEVGVSIFAARHDDEMPEAVYDFVLHHWVHQN